jgi:hypothetical protein
MEFRVDISSNVTGGFDDRDWQQWLANNSHRFATLQQAYAEYLRVKSANTGNPLTAGLSADAIVDRKPGTPPPTSVSSPGQSSATIDPYSSSFVQATTIDTGTMALRTASAVEQAITNDVKNKAVRHTLNHHGATTAAAFVALDYLAKDRTQVLSTPDPSTLATAVAGIDPSLLLNSVYSPDAPAVTKISSLEGARSTLDSQESELLNSYSFNQVYDTPTAQSSIDQQKKVMRNVGKLKTVTDLSLDYFDPDVASKTSVMTQSSIPFNDIAKSLKGKESITDFIYNTAKDIYKQDPFNFVTIKDSYGSMDYQYDPESNWMKDTENKFFPDSTRDLHLGSNPELIKNVYETIMKPFQGLEELTQVVHNATAAFEGFTQTVDNVSDYTHATDAGGGMGGSIPPVQPPTGGDGAEDDGGRDWWSSAKKIFGKVNSGLDWLSNKTGVSKDLLGFMAYDLAKMAIGAAITNLVATRNNIFNGATTAFNVHGQMWSQNAQQASLAGLASSANQLGYAGLNAVPGMGSVMKVLGMDKMLEVNNAMHKALEAIDNKMATLATQLMPFSTALVNSNVQRDISFLNEDIRRGREMGVPLARLQTARTDFQIQFQRTQDKLLMMLEPFLTRAYEFMTFVTTVANYYMTVSDYGKQASEWFTNSTYTLGKKIIGTLSEIVTNTRKQTPLDELNQFLDPNSAIHNPQNRFWSNSSPQAVRNRLNK